MASSVIEQIVLRVRRHLGDMPPSNFQDYEIEGALYDAVDLINLDLETSYVISEAVGEGPTISPDPTTAYRTLLGWMTAFKTLEGRYCQETTGGAGVSWRSGLSSIDTKGQTVSYRDISNKLWNKYHDAIANIKIGNMTLVDIDLYEE